MSDPQFPLDQIRPDGIVPIAVQELPNAVLRMTTWETAARVLAELENTDALTNEQLAGRYSALDLNEATSWLGERGLVQTGLDRHLVRKLSITTFGRQALKLLRAHAGVYG